MDIAELGLSVRSDGVVVATNRLGDLEKGSVRTDKAATALTGTFTRLATVAGAALATAFSVGSVFAFQDSIAEVSTLVDVATFSMAALEIAALDQAATFSNIQGQVGAFYDVISAGAGSVAQANEILTASNKLAIGGVTEIGIAADGLTSILNAYGDKVEGATSVSDALFVAMRDGKTTIGELSSGIGKVAPLAAQLDVEFDELVGSISALTKGGISTQESITGVRAVLAAVAKPTSEAAKLAGELGIEFNSAGLQAKGFQGFIEDLVDKTGGSTDALAQLFGGVEALVPVMALAGQAGKDFAIIMEDMDSKAGATEVAFNKMAASPGFQSDRLMSGITVEAIKLTGALGDQLVPVITLLADNADILVTSMVIMTASVAAFAVVTGGAAVALGVLLSPLVLITAAVAATSLGISYLINRMDDIQPVAGSMANLGDYIKARWETIGSLIATVGGAVSLWATQALESMQRVWGPGEGGAISVISNFYGEYAEMARVGTNGVIATFVGSYDAVVGAWGLLPGAFADIFTMTMNGAIGIVEEKIHGIIDPVNTILSAVNLPTIPEADLSKWKGGITGAATDVAGIVSKSFEDAFATDFVGGANAALNDVFDTIEHRAGQLAGIRRADNALIALANELALSGSPNTPSNSGAPTKVTLPSGVSDAAEKLQDSYNRIIMTADQRIAQMELEGQVLGMTSEAASRLRFEQELLNKAASASIDLTPTQTSQLHELAAEMAATEERTRALTQAANDNAAVWNSAQDGVSGIIKTWAHGGDVLDTLANKITGIADMLIDMAVRDIFMSAFGGGFGGGGGPINLLSGLIGNASGTDSWRGGITAVNELGGEIMNLPKGTQIIPHDVSMRMASNQNQSNDNMPNFTIVNMGTPQRIESVEWLSEDEVRIVTRDEIDEYSRHALPDRVSEINADPRARG